jgi:hypothetical protein
VAESQGQIIYQRKKNIAVKVAFPQGKHIPVFKPPESADPSACVLFGIFLDSYRTRWK